MKSYDQIKNQLQAFESDLDKEKLWANTVHAIPKKKRRYAVLVLFLGGALMLGGGMTMLLVNSNPTGNKLAGEELIEFSSIAQHMTGSQMGPKDLQNEANGEAVLENHIHADDLNTQSSANNLTVEGTPESKTVVQPSRSEIESIESIADASKEAQEAVSLSENTSFESSFPEAAVFDSSQALRRADAWPQVNTLHEEVNVDKMGLLPLRPLPVQEYDAGFISASNKAVIRSKYKKSVALYATQTIGASSLNIKTNSDELFARTNFLEDRVTSLENLSSRIGAQMHLSKRWVVGTGLQWNQLATRTDFAWMEEQRISGDGITTIVIDPDGTQHLHSGVIGITRNAYWQASRYSTHTTLNLEAQIAYQVLRNYRFDLLAGLHGTYNLLYQSQGSTFDLNDQPVLYTAEDQLYDLTSPFNIGMSLTGSYQIGRRLGLQLTLQADRLTYEQPMNQSTLNYHHHIFSMGMGLRYKL